TSDEDGDDDGVVPILPGAVAPAVGADPADDEIDKALDNWIDGLDEQVADGIAGAGDLFPGVTGLLNQGVNPVPVGQPAGDAFVAGTDLLNQGVNLLPGEQPVSEPVEGDDAWIDGLDDVVSDGIAGVGDAFVAGTDLLNQGVNLLPDGQPEADPVDEAVDGWIDGLDDLVSA